MEVKEKAVITDTYHKKPEVATPGDSLEGPHPADENSARQALAPVSSALDIPVESAPPADESPAEAEPLPCEAANPAIKHFPARRASSAWLTEFLDTPSVCRWTVIQLHPEGPRCPACNVDLDHDTAARFTSGKRCRCPHCSTWFTARTGTFLQGSQLSYSQVFLMAALIDLMETGVNVQRIAAAVGASADTVRIWIKRFKAFEGGL